MLKERLHINLFTKKNIAECKWVEPNFRVELLKVAFVILCFFSANLFYGHSLEADSRGRKIQNYVKQKSVLQARKRKARVYAQTEEGRKIQHYLIRKSFLQSNRGKAETAIKEIDDSGLATFEMSKKNRWFVKKSFQTSDNKTSSNNHYIPPKQILEKTYKVSQEALQMTKTRARITGPVKPDVLYSENSSRVALKIAKTRARTTGQVKPDYLYSKIVSREVKGMTLKRSRIRASAKGSRKSAVRKIYIKTTD